MINGIFSHGLFICVYVTRYDMRCRHRDIRDGMSVL